MTMEHRMAQMTLADVVSVTEALVAKENQAAS